MKIKATDDKRSPRSAFAVNNVRWFIAFRMFFNCRFYYPVFTIMFLDFGISVAQFSVLNAIWAATIVMAEVPSGALADIVGRRRLLVFAAVSMLIEMAILCLAPRGNNALLLGFFAVNRILSGLAEAAASGADEALAYDALQAAGMADHWGRVLDVQMRCRSAMFVLAMTIGAAVYDPALMSRVAKALGSGHVFVQAETLRFPVYLTLVMALLTLTVVLRLEETSPHDQNHATPEEKADLTIMQAIWLTLDSGRWILKTPFVLWVILYGMIFDGILRMVITLASQYYRMVQLPESIYGILGSGMALLGLFIPRLAHYIARHRSPWVCLWSTAVTALCGLVGMCFFLPYLGLLPAMVVVSALYMVGFYISYYVNQHTSSSRRATVLSFKGLACNLAYGFTGIAYAGLLEVKKRHISAITDNLHAMDNLVFKQTFAWFPISLAIGVGLITAGLFYLRLRRRQNDHSAW